MQNVDKRVFRHSVGRTVNLWMRLGAVRQLHWQPGIRQANPDKTRDGRESWVVWPAGASPFVCPGSRLVGPAACPAALNNSPLRLASANGHTAVMQARLALPPEPCVDVGTGGTAALYLACRNGHLEAVRALLSLPLEHLNVSHAFHVACERGHMEIVRFLSELPPEVEIDPTDANPGNEIDDEGNSVDCDALAAACMNGHVDVVQLLLALPRERGVYRGA